MTRSLARRLRRALAAVLSAALVLLSPGLEAPRLFAQTVRVVPAAGAASAGASAASAFAPSAAPLSPALALPTLSVAPVAAPLGAPAGAAPLEGFSEALAPHLAAAAAPASDATGAFAAGRGLEDVLTGGRSAGSGDVVAAAAAAAPAAASASPTLAAAAPAEGGKPAASAAGSAPAPQAGPEIGSRAAYKAHALLLKIAAVLTGAVYTLRPAGPALTNALIASAAGMNGVLLDYDDTLAPYNEVLSPEMVAAFGAVRAAGKTADVISDRSDEKRPHQLTVFESLAPLPVATRAGMYVAANVGGRVFRYDEKGEPALVYEAPKMPEEVRVKVAAAAEATKARLSEVGAVQHDGVAKGPAESWGPYSYAMMMKPGSSEASMLGVAKIMQEELDRRGAGLEVTPRFAKDPANPPYIAMSVITKEKAAAYIVKARGLAARDVVVVGDSMYAPREAKKSSWLTRLAEKVSGRPIPALGNRTDANMEKGVPGALTLSVGETGDPRPANLYVLAGKGPAVTQRVLQSLASQRARFWGSRSGLGVALRGVGVVAVLVGAVLGVYVFSYAIADLLIAVMGWLRAAFDSPQVDTGMPPLMLLGAVGALGFGGLPSGVIANPRVDYAEALKKAVEVAAARGAAADQVRFLRATASMPVADGQHWKYSFDVIGKDGRHALVSVDASRFLGGSSDLRVFVYEGDWTPAGHEFFDPSPYYFSKGLEMDPQHALDAIRRQVPAFGTRVSATVDFRHEPVSHDGDYWYGFYDEKGGVASINTRTGEVRVEAGLGRAPSLRASISSASPVDGFETIVYERALESARGLAAKAGYAPDKLRFARAELKPREWGEDWTFSFASPREARGMERPRAYEVTVRRTMVAETQLDAIEEKDLGPLYGWFPPGVPAAELPRLVRVEPMEAVAKTREDARTLELQARWDRGFEQAQLWYVVRGEKGREVMDIHAGTGGIELPSAWASLKRALIPLGLLAAVAAIYGLIWYAVGQAPASVPAPAPGGEQFVPEGLDIGRMFGGFLGAGLMAGSLSAASGSASDAGAPASAKAEDPAALMAASQAAYRRHESMDGKKGLSIMTALVAGTMAVMSLAAHLSPVYPITYGVVTALAVLAAFLFHHAAARALAASLAKAFEALAAATDDATLAVEKLQKTLTEGPAPDAGTEPKTPGR